MAQKFFIIAVTLIFLFSCTKYTDNIRLAVEKPTIPVLVKKKASPVMKLDIIRNDTSSYVVENINLSLRGTTDISDIKSVAIYGANTQGLIDTTNLICKTIHIEDNIVFSEMFEVFKDTLSLWVAISLRDSVSLDHKINVNCTGITTSKGSVRIDKLDDNPLRIGVAIRQHMQDNVHSSRIPGIATSKNGALMAIFDARYDSSRDLQGHMDIAMHRSVDKGQTWQPMQILLDMGEWGGLPQKYNGVSDACILVDQNNGDIYVAGLWMYGILDDNGKWVEGLTENSDQWIHQWKKKGSQSGFSVKQTSQFLITKSSDNGLTWSEPVNITTMAKRKEWWLFAPAPGQGITMKDGTLVMPTQGRDSKGKPFSNITWSKDSGRTWTTSNPAFEGVTECNVVELSDGSLMLNMRDNRNRGDSITNGRRICTTTDLGKTWTEHPTSRKALIEPTCMGSIYRHVYTEKGVEKSILLFSNPNSYSKREKMTLKVSFDDGNTWPEDKWILYDQYISKGYSSITSVDENTIGILYESSQADLAFIQIKLTEILE